MANYQSLKAAINSVIKANGKQEITGTALNEILTAMVNSLGADYQFAGVATTSTNPGTPDQNVFYIGGQAGTYTNFNSIELPNGVSILKWNGSWSSEMVVVGDDKPTYGSNNLVLSGGVYGLSSLSSFFDDVDVFHDSLSPISVGDAVVGILKRDGTVDTTTFVQFKTTQLIELDKAKDYYFTPNDGGIGDSYARICLYDYNQNLIKAYLGYADQPPTFNGANNNIYKILMPAGATYARFSGSAQFGIKIYTSPKVNSLDDRNVGDTFHQTVGGVNLYNYLSSSIDKWMQAAGSIIDYTNGFVSDYMYVKGKTTVFMSGLGWSITYSLYDAQKNRLSGGYYDAANGISIGDAVYLRVSETYNDISAIYKKEMVCANSLPSVFVPYNNADLLSGYKTAFAKGISGTEIPHESIQQLISTTYEVGIFGETTYTGFQTSDYIPCTGYDSLFYNVSSVFGDSFKKIVFYDKEKNEILAVTNADIRQYADSFIKIILPPGAEYIRYARVSTVVTDGLCTMTIKNAAEAIMRIVNSVNTGSNHIVWVGTSIPEGATYPSVASVACGYDCIKNCLGQQSLAIRSGSPMCMMYTEQEFRNNFTSEIGSTMTQTEFNLRLDRTFERAVIPFVKGESLVISDGMTTYPNNTINPDGIKISALIVDHGYNDYANIAQLLQNEQSIDWTSRDRSNFVGAFNYLLDEVRKYNPTLKIVISGYFQDKWLVGDISDVCKIQKLYAEKFSIEIMEAWKNTQITADIIKDTSTYMTNYNSTYGTSWTVPSSYKDAQGNISARYIYLPDGIHPHSDLTQNCNKRLNAVYTKLLSHII